MGSAPQEPWAFGEPWESICRDMIALRMRLLPYLYGLFEEAARTGAPVLRPLLFEHPDDPATYTADDEFLLGDALLAAPITRPGIEHRHVYLPAGTWVQWWTGERVEGPAHVLAHAPLGRPGALRAAHAAIPLWPVLQHTGERAAGRARRCAWPARRAPPPRERELYEDAGEGYGEHARRAVRCDDARTTVRCGSSWASAAAAGSRRASGSRSSCTAWLTPAPRVGGRRDATRAGGARTARSWSSCRRRPRRASWWSSPAARDRAKQARPCELLREPRGEGCV